MNENSNLSIGKIGFMRLWRAVMSVWEVWPWFCIHWGTIRDFRMIYLLVATWILNLSPISVYLQARFGKMLQFKAHWYWTPSSVLAPTRREEVSYHGETAFSYSRQSDVSFWACVPRRNRVPLQNWNWVVWGVYRYISFEFQMG